MPRVRRSPQRQRLPSAANAVVTSLLLPRPLHRRLRLEAYALNWTLAHVLRQAAVEWLARHGREGK